jgi:hypothetical protein
LLATVGALLLVPAAQAFAAGHMTVTIIGTGKGKVVHFEEESPFQGNPPIECSYESPGPATGICEAELGVFEEGEEVYEGLFVKEVAAAGSEFAGWELEGEAGFGSCSGQQCNILGEGGTISSVHITGYFNCTEAGEEEELCGGPSGPTNLRTLTVKKAGPANSVGTVKSKPKGVNCASACSEATASYYKNTNVTLEAKPATGSSFTGWSGGGCSGTGTCVVPMTEAQEVTATFAPVGAGSKEILNPVPLTLTKGASTGKGTVKATGLACEAECNSTVVNYSSGGGPKAKPATIVTLTATTAPGSTFTGWEGSGCSGTGTCIVTMSEAKSVTATFTALPKNTLTVKKAGPANSAGTVKSKPKAINCASACSEATASLSSDTTVTLEAKPATGSSFTGWSGGGCSGTGTCVVAMTEAQEVTATFAPVGLGGKEILNPVSLTLAKAGSGYGTVKATGLACEVLCTSTKVSYSSGGGPKAKPATIVTLEAVSAPGSQTVVWTGCESEPEGKCVVTMSAAKEVTATFNELE